MSEPKAKAVCVECRSEAPPRLRGAGAVREFARASAWPNVHAASRRMFSCRPAITAGGGCRFRG